MDRRAFIQAGAALPAAAIAGAVNAPLITATAAALPSPYVEYPWQWWVSYDGEIYNECFDTFEVALECAKQSEYTVVAECKQTHFHLDVSGDDILELLDGQNEELRGEGDGIECTNEQAHDLGSLVTASIEAWVIKHKIGITAWSFGGVRNKTTIDNAPAPALTPAVDRSDD